MGLVGGVNLSLQEGKYGWLRKNNFLSTEGLCKSFGEGGDGYVPGEGVGAVLIKPLAAAEADGDRILPVPLEHIARDKQAKDKAADSATVKTAQQAKIEVRLEVQLRDAAEQQAGHRKVLGKAHNTVDSTVREQLAPSDQIPEANDDKNGDNDFEQDLHLIWIP